MNKKTWSDYGITINTAKGGQQKIQCPKCAHSRTNKNSKDLSVNVDLGVWKCHRAKCGWSGSLKNNYQKIQQYQAQTQKVYKKPEPVTDSDLPEKVLDYFQLRGISLETLKNCGVTYEQRFMPQTGKTGNCIVFNYYINGEVINKKFRDGHKNMGMAKDARLVMYAPLAKTKHEYRGDLYITEGEPDCLSLIECGCENAMSIPNGAPALTTNLSNCDFSYLDSLLEIMPEYDKVFLIMDNDEPGERLRNELARRFGIERSYKPEYPDDCKDFNDVLRIHGKETAKTVLFQCKAYPYKGKYDVNDLWLQFYNLYLDGYDSGLSTGWDSLRSLYNIKRQQVTIVTGIPSAGKSAWMDNLIVNLAKIHEFKTAIFSPENYPFERHLAKLSEVYIGKPFDKNTNGGMEDDDFYDALDWLNRYFYFIMPEDDGCTIEDILKLARVAVLRNGIDGLVIDPWNEIEHSRGRQSETEYVSETLSKVRKFSRLNNIHIWIVAHPTKLPKDKDGHYAPPTPYDISGSAHFRNKADNCICIHRDMDKNITQVLIQKIRFKEVGMIGDANFVYEQKTGRFSSLDIYSDNH